MATHPRSTNDILRMAVIAASISRKARSAPARAMIFYHTVAWMMPQKRCRSLDLVIPSKYILFILVAVKFFEELEPVQDGPPPLKGKTAQISIKTLKLNIK
jgi:hypothetical protein